MTASSDCSRRVQVIQQRVKLDFVLLKNAISGNLQACRLWKISHVDEAIEARNIPGWRAATVTLSSKKIIIDCLNSTSFAARIIDHNFSVGFLKRDTVWIRNSIYFPPESFNPIFEKSFFSQYLYVSQKKDHFASARTQQNGNVSNLRYFSGSHRCFSQ